jgi:hypothetical protein
MESRQDPDVTRRQAVPRRYLPRSLRGQLVLIPTAILMLGLLGTVGAVLLDARDRIAAEITSGMRLGHYLVALAFRDRPMSRARPWRLNDWRKICRGCGTYNSS